MAGFHTPVMLHSEKQTPPLRRLLSLACLMLAVLPLGAAFPRNSLNSVDVSNIRDAFTTSHPPSAQARSVDEFEPLNDNGILVRSSDVQFDNYTLILKGQRVFLQYVVFSKNIYSTWKVLNNHPYCSSGEFHTFRLPVPSLWPDILEKVKAAGMNAISVYTHMGLINPAPGVVDFSGFRALQPLFDAAKDAGIWIVLRPGNCCLPAITNICNSFAS